MLLFKFLKDVKQECLLKTNSIFDYDTMNPHLNDRIVQLVKAY